MKRVLPDKEYIISLRRELHRYPEVGFDLPKTLALVRRELDALGIEYTERYGKSSIVGYLAKGRGRVLAMRADMDALPIEERTGLPFSSEHEGMMHACGHDAHTAMLLGTAKMLKEIEDELPCEVRLFFQAAEEYAPGGAKLMSEDGAMDEVDAIIGAHVAASVATGKISFNYGSMTASSHGFYLDIYGKSAHAAAPQYGVDAIALSYEIYGAIQLMRAREINPKAPVVVGIGEIHGGHANNVVCDYVRMHGTIRSANNETDETVFRRIDEIAKSVTATRGARYELTTTKRYPVLTNDESLARMLYDCGARVLGAENVIDTHTQSMGGEDFAFFSERKPGVFFDIGARNEGYPISPAHNPGFIIDEDALTVGPRIFTEFLFEYAKSAENMTK